MEACSRRAFYWVFLIGLTFFGPGRTPVVAKPATQPVKIIRPLPKLPGSLPDSGHSGNRPRDYLRCLGMWSLRYSSVGSTTSGSNCVPVHLRTSSAAPSNETGVLYGRL